ncbi:hypothetical protein H6P81_007170 [Aristolochia fimbriata]|uniref:Uncharacterized protein n=1 Tax=Aristolochia fimbriata TaxID=158543 RepID=A0AAV7F0L6_ARIFI|nr:hypothetical protein H6P81_007170 [Aristolochia fimbriata]
MVQINRDHVASPRLGTSLRCGVTLTKTSPGMADPVSRLLQWQTEVESFQSQVDSLEATARDLEAYNSERDNLSEKVERQASKVEALREEIFSARFSQARMLNQAKEKFSTLQYKIIQIQLTVQRLRKRVEASRAAAGGGEAAGGGAAEPSGV